MDGTIADLPRPVGYVLGGGGSLGAVQVGMLQALSERDAPPDIVTGTSVGSLNGVVLAMDPRSAANRLSHLWPRLSRERRNRASRGRDAGRLAALWPAHCRQR